MKILNYLLKLSIIFFCFFGSNIISEKFKKPPLVVSKQDSSISINNYLVNLFSLGQKRMISSLLWVKTMLDSDLDHYKEEDYNNWFYLNIRTINSLDPNFYEPYIYGGLYLSIVKDDAIGAMDIYERGLNIFPNDFYLNLNAGFHSYFEMGDKEKAIKLYQKIVNHPNSPINIPFLIARIMSENEQLESAFEYLQSQLKYAPKGSNMESKLNSDLYAIKAEIDLKCLNEKSKRDCDFKDYFGNNYKKIGNRYESVIKWDPYRVKRKLPSKR